MVKYVYDAWGNHAVLNSDGTVNASDSFIGNLNPYRYRGYYYDTETGLYFLKTRYYDPEVGRFITIDDLQYLDPEIINGLNLYVYCGNNPVMNVDPNGTWSWKKIFGVIAAGITAMASFATLVAGLVLMSTGVGIGAGTVLIGAGVGGLANMASSLYRQVRSNGWKGVDWGVVAINGLAGMATGALMASPLGAVATGFAIAGVTFVQNVGLDLWQSGGDWSQVNWGRAAVSGVVSGALSGLGKYFLNNSTLMNKFVNSSKTVQQLGAESLAKGFAGRGAYTDYWMHVIILQGIYKKGISALTSILNAIANAIINAIFN